MFTPCTRFLLRLGWLLGLLGITCFVLVATPQFFHPQPVSAQSTIAPNIYAGAYRIEEWRLYEKKQVEHFFFLHPSGTFLLAAALRGRENTRVGGHWQVAGDELILQGIAHVWTNQGEWRTPFWRRFIIQPTTIKNTGKNTGKNADTDGSKGWRLVPIPEKNRYGLLGWPNAFVYAASQPLALPGQTSPADPRNLLQAAKALLKAIPSTKKIN